MKRICLLFLALTLSSCGGSATVYNRLGNFAGSVQAQTDTAIILDANGAQVGNVSGRDIRNTAGVVIGKAIKREGLILIEGDEATGYVQDETDCYDVTGYKQGRLTSKVDPEAAAGACLLLILR